MFFRKSSGKDSATVTDLRPVDYNGHLPGTEMATLQKDLPDWKLRRHSFTYESNVMPSQDDISNVTAYLSEAYGLKLLHATVSLVSGHSWTASDAKFSIDIVLLGTK